MILILSDDNDAHCNAVIQKLKDNGTSYFRLNLNTLALLKTFITYKGDTWEIITEEKQIFSNQIRCVWNRRTYVELLLEESSVADVSFNLWKNEWNKTLLGLYNSLMNLPWLNYYRNSHLAENKYLQAKVAKSLGLHLPNTIVSNDKKELVEFAKKFTFVALKLMHQDFYEIRPKEYMGFYVNKIAAPDLENFGDSSENPVVLQEYVEKDFEVRYTVVGQLHFVCKIESQLSEKAKDDWRRYDLPNTPHSIIEPPADVREKVASLMLDMNLIYGALDFIVTKDGRWVFLEVNPMGQFLWIEDLTGLPITNAISDWLIKNSIQLL